VNIAVSWQKPGTGAEHQGIYDFPTIDIAPTISTDRSLGFPSGTTAILNHAFEHRLKRFQQWRLPSSQNCRDAFFHAASIFRRGVPAQCGDEILEISEKSGSYRIVEEKFPSNRRGDGDQVFYVIDQALLTIFPDLAKLTPTFKLTANESTKSLETCSKIIHAWRSNGGHAHWVIIGGGLTGDIGAFAADLTGSKFSLVPTTLLAMVDACVGGKTGVNYAPYGKNQVGRFAFPESVIIDRRFLKSLSDRQFRSGIAECVKHAILAGSLERIDQLTTAAAAMDRNLAADHLEEFIRYKVKIIESDPDERGIRAVLNFGHTFGHAIETLSIEYSELGDEAILHGEAVAAGMVCALLVSRDFAGLKAEDANGLVTKILRSKIIPNAANFLRMTGIDPHSTDSSWEKVLKLMSQDKKNTASLQAIDFVLISAIGQPIPASGRYTVPIPIEGLKSVFAEFARLMLEHSS
jgi:3-dehydroquinate synthase